MVHLSRSKPEGSLLGVIALGGMLISVAGASQASPKVTAVGALVASHLCAWWLFDPALRATPAVAVLPFGRWRLFATMAVLPVFIAQLPAMLLFVLLPGFAHAILLNAGVLLANLWMMLVRFAFPESSWRGNLAYSAGLLLMAALAPLGLALAILFAVIATGRRPGRHALA